MKGSIFAAAALVGSAMADAGMHRRHEAIHNRRHASSSVAVSPSSLIPGPEETCGCSTKVVTVWGSPTLVPEPTAESTTTSTSTLHSTSTATQTVTVTPSVEPVQKSTSATPVATLPTPGVTSFSSTGVYTIPATTLTVTDTTTVCGATTTEVPSGTHTIGGVTTIVETSTVITCPYATVKPSGTTVTSVVEMTTYTCPAAGTYTVVPGTVTSVPTSTVLVYPTPQTITPGTYTQPASVVTVTRTDYTYVCPFATGLASTTAPAATVPVVAATTTAVSVPVPAVSSAPSVVSSSPSVASSSPAPASTGSSSSSGVTGAGQYGMTFSPYTSSGGCMPQADIFNNLKVIQSKGFNLVRVYSTDCNGLEYIGSACKELGLKMMMGVFIGSGGISAAQEQVDAIAKWAQWEMVELIVVGNEAISSGACSASDLASFVSSSKGTFQAAGYSGRVTTTEPINIWQQYGKSTLCSVVDIVGANIHPFFNADVTAEKAGEFALAELKELEAICGKDVINCETGWPNAGDANGAAVPGTAQQEAAIKSIVSAIGSKSVFFSYADDAWKQPGAFNVEQHWGCASVF